MLTGMMKNPSHAMPKQKGKKKKAANPNKMYVNPTIHPSRIHPAHLIPIAPGPDREMRLCLFFFFFLGDDKSVKG
jgi:hypothetical protein